MQLHAPRLDAPEGVRDTDAQEAVWFKFLTEIVTRK
jgi:hypothetical protein